MVKYPHVSVKLVGEDGNAFAILGPSPRRCVRLRSTRPRSRHSRTKRPVVTTIICWQPSCAGWRPSDD